MCVRLCSLLSRIDLSLGAQLNVNRLQAAGISNFDVAHVISYCVSDRSPCHNIDARTHIQAVRDTATTDMQTAKMFNNVVYANRTI